MAIPDTVEGQLLLPRLPVLPRCGVPSWAGSKARRSGGSRGAQLCFHGLPSPADGWDLGAPWPLCTPSPVRTPQASGEPPQPLPAGGNSHLGLGEPREPGAVGFASSAPIRFPP